MYQVRHFEEEPGRQSAAKLLTTYSDSLTLVAGRPSVRCGIRSVACRLHLRSIALKRPFGSRLDQDVWYRAPTLDHKWVLPSPRPIERFQIARLRLARRSSRVSVSTWAC